MHQHLMKLQTQQSIMCGIIINPQNHPSKKKTHDLPTFKDTTTSLNSQSSSNVHAIMKVIFSWSTILQLFRHTQVFLILRHYKVYQKLCSSQPYIEQLAPFYFWLIGKTLLEKDITNDQLLFCTYN